MHKLGGNSAVIRRISGELILTPHNRHTISGCHPHILANDLDLADNIHGHPCAFAKLGPALGGKVIAAKMTQVTHPDLLSLWVTGQGGHRSKGFIPGMLNGDEVIIVDQGYSSHTAGDHTAIFPIAIGNSPGDIGRFSSV